MGANKCAIDREVMEVTLSQTFTNVAALTYLWSIIVASFPGPARSLLAVRNSRRGPGLVHHVMCAAAYVTSILLESRCHR